MPCIQIPQKITDTWEIPPRNSQHCHHLDSLSPKNYRSYNFPISPILKPSENISSIHPKTMHPQMKRYNKAKSIDIRHQYMSTTQVPQNFANTTPRNPLSPQYHRNSSNLQISPILRLSKNITRIHPEIVHKAHCMHPTEVPQDSASQRNNQLTLTAPHSTFLQHCSKVAKLLKNPFRFNVEKKHFPTSQIRHQRIDSTKAPRNSAVRNGQHWYYTTELSSLPRSNIVVSSQKTIHIQNMHSPAIPCSSPMRNYYVGHSVLKRDINCEEGRM
jgi:hypothetical protein